MSAAASRGGEPRAATAVAKGQTTELYVLWRPAWHGVDRGLTLGERARFCLVPVGAAAPHSSTHAAQAIHWEFSRGLLSGKSPEEIERWGTIAAIEHADLGSLRAVHTVGLDYRFSLASGEELVVDAEEEPGRCANQLVSVRAWDLLVTLRS